MVFFYKVYIGYIGGTLYSANSSIGYCKRYCLPSVEKCKLEEHISILLIIFNFLLVLIRTINIFVILGI